MSDFLPILDAAEPTVIPAKTYDRVWIEEVIIKAPDPNIFSRKIANIRSYVFFP